MSDDSMPLQFATDAEGRKCVKVRIAVAVDSNGEWVAHSYWFDTRETSTAAVKRFCWDRKEKNIAYVYALVPLAGEHGEVVWGDDELV
jgi:hypothetical protein